jgi:hypothetical protein
MSRASLWLQRALLAFVVVQCAGCAHTMVVGPDADKLPAASASRMDVTAAYVMTEAQRGLVTTTAGGGGDKASYQLYHDLEPALFRVLSNRFANAFVVASIDDKKFLADKNVQFVFTPNFRSNSSSSSLLTWPPTDFTLTIDIQAQDAQGRKMWQDKVAGTGHAEFSEFKHDFGLSAKRAAQDAFGKLQQALQSFPTTLP